MFTYSTLRHAHAVLLYSVLAIAMSALLTAPSVAQPEDDVLTSAQNEVGQSLGDDAAADTGDDEPQNSGIKYQVEEKGEYAPSLLKALQASLPLYVNRKTNPRSRAQLRDRLKSSLDVAETVLKSQGYYAGKIRGRIAAQVSRDEPQRVILTIRSGQRYVYDSAAIRLNTETTNLAEDLSKTAEQLTTKSKPAMANVGVRLAPALTVRLKELGYPFAKVTNQRFIVDHAAKTVKPLIDIDPGQKARIAEINILGLTTVEPGYVRLLADITDNPIYDQRQIDTFRDRLIQTGLFSGIRILPQLPTGPAVDGAADIALAVELSEADLRQVSVQAGFSTDEGFSIEGSWTHRNFFGQGEIFTVTGQIAELEQSVDTTLTLPNFKLIDQSLTFGLGFGREDTDAFTLLGVETSAILERRLTKRWIISGGGRLEAQTIEDIDGERTFYLGGLPLSARYDGAENIFDPQDGIRINATVTPEVGFGDESLIFVTSDILLRGYKSFDLAYGTVLAARLRVGSVFGEGARTLPASRRFYAGGGGSIRGYGFQNVGPLDRNEDPFGGRSLLEMAAEVRVKVTPTIGVVPFVDAGNVYGSTLPNFSRLQYGAGIGLRYHTAFAPIRLDIGTPLNPRPSDDRVQIYISIGQSF